MMMPLGLKSKCSATIAAIFSSEITPVPMVLMVMFMGRATPIAYATWIWHWVAKPAATTFFAT